MNLQTITKTIDGVKFLINQAPARKVLKLEKKTVSYLSPLLEVLEGLKDLNMDADIDFSKIVSAVQKTLMGIKEDELEQYIFDMLEYVSVEKNTSEGTKIYNMNNTEHFDLVFRGSTLTVYKLLLEVMRANNFFFFALLGGGGQNLTGYLSQMMGKMQK